jgi:two-component system, sensor histidine kinase
MDQNPIIDKSQLESLRELSQPGEKDFVSELIDIFLQQSPLVLAELEAGVKNGDALTIEKLAHKFKGSCGNIGAVRLQKLCAELETLGRNKEVAKAKTVFAEVPPRYAEACEVLRRDWYKS